MKSLTLGKMRGLQQCATPDGKLVILAVDHRDSLRVSLDPANPDGLPAEVLVEFKRDVVGALARSASAVLLDPEYGVGPCIESGALPGATGLMFSMERAGWTGAPHARVTEILPGWNPERAARLGNVVKLLVWYHPDSVKASQAEGLVRRTSDACAAIDAAFLLEALTYSIDPSQRRLQGEERRRAVLETARILTAIPGVDAYKAEFPLDIVAVPEGPQWLAACQELDAACTVPWVLLSAGVDFETFMLQVVAAARAGASGVAVGRAVWQEATGLWGEERAVFLRTIARERMERVLGACRALARPWFAERPTG